jgi:Bacterial regulatory proteins, tetR family
MPEGLREIARGQRADHEDADQLEIGRGFVAHATWYAVRPAKFWSAAARRRFRKRPQAAALQSVPRHNAHVEQPKRGRGRPRRAGADDEILAVTLAMLKEGGYGALTVDAVAERSGVAKTTLYRRWPSKSALVAAAIGPSAAKADDAALLQFFQGAEPEAIEVIAEILRPRHQALAARLGEAEADRIIGALLTRLFVTRRI